MSEVLGDKNIPSGMPPMDSALDNWFQTITMYRTIQQVVNNGLVQNNVVPFTFQGTIQPLSPRQIALKPEGQRSWTWLQVHAISSCELVPNDIVQYFGNTYKVMALLDYSLNGYVEYHLVKDYQ